MYVVYSNNIEFFFIFMGFVCIYVMCINISNWSLVIFLFFVLLYWYYFFGFCVVVMFLFWYCCVIWWVRKMFVYIINGLIWWSVWKIILIIILEVFLIIEIFCFFFGENNVKIIYVFCIYWNVVFDICWSFYINFEMIKLGLV